MGVEYMLYFYGAVCFSMILFNVAYTLLLRGSGLRMDRRRRALAGRIRPQLDRLALGQKIVPSHLTALRRALRRVKNLVAFDLVLKELQQNGQADLVTRYLEQIQPAILYLAVSYQRRDTINAAYFSYVLAHYMAPTHMPIHSVQGVLLDYMRKENLYCRVNALQALCRFGSVENLFTAVRILDQGQIFLHEKILTEALLTFTGDHHLLIGKLWDQLDRFSPHTQLAISNYIRFRSGEYAPQMLTVLKDARRNKELRLSAVRYLGRYPCPDARAPLLDLARQTDPEQWEYVTVSVSALASYPGHDTVEVLKQALHHPNWYVRYAAAVSLEALDVDHVELMDILTGNDRYAREMLTYRLKTGNLQKAGV